MELLWMTAVLRAEVSALLVSGSDHFPLDFQSTL